MDINIENNSNEYTLEQLKNILIEKSTDIFINQISKDNPDVSILTEHIDLINISTTMEELEQVHFTIKPPVKYEYQIVSDDVVNKTKEIKFIEISTNEETILDVPYNTFDMDERMYLNRYSPYK